MEILADKYNLAINHAGSLSEVSHNGPDIVERLIWFFTLTEEGRLKAGIYVGGEGSDWIDRSALILSPRDLN